MYDEKRRNGELAAAREDGIAEGRAEGRIEGREEANMEVAKKMLAAGIPVEQIAQFTGLNLEVIGSLK